ncbi:MAG: hypothetical protein H6892_07110 [Brucellaceae bacterium]|nr:hypothetical protein [Brucellaceae bacterium]
MQEDDFRQHFVPEQNLNVDCMLASQNEYDAHLSKMVGYIRSSFDDCGAFFTVYYVGGKYVAELLTLLVSRWPGFVSAALSATQSAAHVARILAHLPEADLKRLGEKGSELGDFTSNNLSAILALGIDFEPARLALIEFEAKELKSLEAYPAISRQLTDNGWYEISIENIEFIFRYVLRSPTADGLKTKHYSTVLNSGDNTLIGKLDNEFAHYLQDVLLKLDTNSEEDISAIVAALQHEEGESEQLERFVEKQSSVLPSLEPVPQRLRLVGVSPQKN